MSNAYRDILSIGTPSYELHTGETYFDDLSSDIDNLEHGAVSISTMGLDHDDPNVLKVTRSLTSAAKRGLNASLTVDSFSLLDKTKVGIWGTALSREDWLLKNLRSTGVMTGYSNYPNVRGFYHAFPSNVYTGRSHIKSATVGNKLYLGGISLDATDRLDAMVSFEHPLLATNMQFLNRMTMASSVRSVLADKDHVFTFDESTNAKLLVDSGVKGQSVIFDEALSIVDNAQQNLVYASEQFPSGKIGKHLLAAFERGVEVKIAMNHPNSHDRYRLAHKAILLAAKKQYPSEFFDNQLPEGAPTLHTKAIASESRAMLGSHNLNTIGVSLGTAELDVVSSDPKFVEMTSDLLIDQMNLSIR